MRIGDIPGRDTGAEPDQRAGSPPVLTNPCHHPYADFLDGGGMKCRTCGKEWPPEPDRSRPHDALVAAYHSVRKSGHGGECFGPVETIDAENIARALEILFRNAIAEMDRTP